jgi:hypothetical protein
MIVPENPTPEQEAYLTYRLIRGYRANWENNLRDGKPHLPPLRPLRPGDFVP